MKRQREDGKEEKKKEKEERRTEERMAKRGRARGIRRARGVMMAGPCTLRAGQLSLKCNGKQQHEQTNKKKKK